MRILVTGGAGYIGSVLVRKLVSFGCEVIVFDNFSTGFKESVSALTSVKLVSGDLTNKGDFEKLKEFSDIFAVIHLAGLSSVIDSLSNPYEYFKVNVTGLLNLLEFMKEVNIKRIIFASDAALYGDSASAFSEEAPVVIKHPYAETKNMGEKLLGWYDYTCGIKAVSLRLSEVGGATMDGNAGDAKPSGSFVTIAIQSSLSDGDIKITGTGRDTIDGSFARDFLFIEDAVEAFVKALDFLAESSKSEIFNVSSGKVSTHKQIIYEVEAQTGKNLNVTATPKKIYEAVSIPVDNSKAKKQLGWEPKHTISDIVQTALYWHVKHPEGYR